jgi:hypothetical protein
MFNEALDQDDEVSLLQLPEHCLVTVLRCCAGDPGSVCSAARAHSRLHQAAVEALKSITAEVNQKQLDTLMGVYLNSHGQHSDSISLEVEYHKAKESPVTLRQLPETLTKLSSITLEHLHLQLQPGEGYQGVLGAAAVPSLKKLQLKRCTLLDGEEGLAAALALLPGLEHLSIISSLDSKGFRILTPLDAVIPGLQRLTYLELDRQDLSACNDDELDVVGARDATDAVLQHLIALTRLVDLWLTPGVCSMTASMLSGTQHLTRLDLTGQAVYEPAALAGKTKLQHLNICLRPGGAAGTAQLLCVLRELQQLTCLILFDDLHYMEVSTPAAAYSALTASSKLQVLDVSYYGLPAGVWQHVFPASRQLQHMRSLSLTDWSFSTAPVAAPEGTRLVSCCPGLQSLAMWDLQYGTGLLTELQGLSSLTALFLHSAPGSAEGFEGVCHLTGLRRLEVGPTPDSFAGLAASWQLRQLTYLSYWGCGYNGSGLQMFKGKVGMLIFRLTCMQPMCWMVCLCCVGSPDFSWQGAFRSLLVRHRCTHARIVAPVICMFLCSARLVMDMCSQLKFFLSLSQMPSRLYTSCGRPALLMSPRGNVCVYLNAGSW